MAQSLRKQDYRAAGKERAAREKGKSLPHYARKVTGKLLSPGNSNRVTPSKKATRS